MVFSICKIWAISSWPRGWPALVEQFRSLGKASPLAVVRDRIVRACCRMSIKAGQPLGHEEIAQILQMLKTTPKLTCPHGRPIVMIIAKGDLEKNFKRIQ